MGSERDKSVISVPKIVLKPLYSKLSFDTAVPSEWMLLCDFTVKTHLKTSKQKAGGNQIMKLLNGLPNILMELSKETRGINAPDANLTT